MFTKLKKLTLTLFLILPLAANALDRVSLLPADAQSYVRISNVTNFWNQLQQSSIGKLWADPQFQSFMGNPDADIWEELFFEGELDAEDEVFVEQLKMLKGEVILAFDLKMENPYIIAAISKDAFIQSLDMDMKLREIMDEPFEIVKSTFQDVEIIQHIKDNEESDETSSWQAHLNETLVMGYSREWVERCIVQLKKEEIKEPAGNPLLHLNLPLANLIQKFIEEENKALAYDPEPLEMALLFDALGLMGIESYSINVELKADELIADNYLCVSDLTKGIFTLIDTQPSELPTVTFIPENITSLEVGRLNLLRFWQEIPNVLAAAMPSAKPQFDMILGMLQLQAGINIEEDLLANISTKYVSFSVAEAHRQISVVAVELKNGPAFKTGIESVLASPALQPQVAAGIETIDFLDHTIYVLKSDDLNNRVSFGVVGDYLLYGQPDGLRQVIRSQNSDMAANNAFERSPLVVGLRQQVPASAFGYSVIDWEKNMAVIIQELNKPEYILLMQQNWAKSGSALPPPDFNKLPQAEHIASFFNISYQYVEKTDDGLHQRIILKY